VLRAAIPGEHTLRLAYSDASGKATTRTVWPIALAFFDHVRILVAWCETRQDFRHFRCDRIAKAQPTGARAPRRRQALLAEWRAKEGVPEQLRLDGS